ncbi:MAG: hypothetical protein RMK01_11885 [Thermomicrobium sp.]|nr:hypothetical protein [Thermomicrobium sp.]MDW8060763.1 hypothetical protein [Thermomicrobium sp.]
MRWLRSMSLLVAFGTIVLTPACRGELVAVGTPVASANERARGMPTATATVPRPVAPVATRALPTATVVTPATPSPTPVPATPTALASLPVGPSPAPGSPPAASSSPTAAPLPTAPPTPSPTAASPTVPTARCDLAVSQAVAEGPDAGTAIVSVTVENRGDGTCPAGAVLAARPATGLDLEGPVRASEAGGAAGWQCSELACTASNAIPPRYAATLFFVATGSGSGPFEQCVRVAVSGDSEPANDADCAAVALPATPTPVTCSFGLEKSVSRATAPGTSGGSVSVRVVLANAGPVGCAPERSELVIVDELPSGMAAGSVQVTGQAGWTCATSDTVVQCSGPPPGPGERVVVTFQASVRAGDAALVNCAWVEPLAIRACSAVR